MGLLDDAIREHLELKRRHGGDPDEIARQENEALGATRRAEFARPEGGDEAAAEASAEPSAPDAESAPAAEPSAAAAEDPLAPPEFLSERAAPAEPPAAEPEPSEPSEPEPEPVAREHEIVAPPEPVTESEPVAEAEAPVEAGDEREPFDIEAVEPAPGAAEPPTERQDPWLEDEPDEVPADEALDHPRTAEPEEGEDVLEETPDFLQETPEHDRLWFEQRPPRDFDWDK